MRFLRASVKTDVLGLLIAIAFGFGVGVLWCQDGFMMAALMFCAGVIISLLYAYERGRL